MKRVVVLGLMLVSILATGCYNTQWDSLYTGTSIIVPDGVETVYDITVWIENNIEPKTDLDVWGKEDYWQTPKQTMELRTGDCEDHAILMMAMMYDLGYTPSFLVIITVMRMDIIDLSGDPIGFHAIVLYDGQYYEPDSSGEYWFKDVKVEEIYTYKETMMFVEQHNGPVWKGLDG